MADYPVFNSDDFTFKNNVFSAEISDFGPCEFTPPAHFGIKSAKTGKVANFMYAFTDYDSGGDVLGWNYKCSTDGLSHLRVLLIND